MSNFLSGIYADALKPAKSPFFDPTPTAPRATPGDGSGNHSMRSTGDMPAAYQPAPVAPTPSPYAPPSGSVTAPNISASPTAPNLTRDIYAPQLNDVTQKLNAAYQAPRPGMARQIIGGVLTGMNPRNPIGGLVSGETQRQQTIQPLTQQEDLLSKIIQMNHQQTLNDADVANKNASTGYFNAHANAITNPPERPKEEEWSVIPNVAGPNGEPLQQEKNSGQVRAVPLAGASRQEKEKTPNEKEQEVSDYLQGRGMPDTPAMRDKARVIIATRNRVPKDPEIADINKQLKQAQLDKLNAPNSNEHDLEPVVGYDQQGKAHIVPKSEAVASGYTNLIKASDKDVNDAKTHHVTLNDMQTKLNDVVSNASALDQDGMQRGIISHVLTHAEPGILNDFTRNTALKGATDKTKQYIQSVQSLKESALGLPKELTGGARVSDIQGNALFQTLPSGASVDSSYALGQAKKFQANLDRLRERAPIVRGIQVTPGMDTGAATAGKMVRARDPQGKLHEAPAGTALPTGWKPE